MSAFSCRCPESPQDVPLCMLLRTYLQIPNSKHQYQILRLHAEVLYQLSPRLGPVSLSPSQALSFLGDSAPRCHAGSVDSTIASQSFRAMTASICGRFPCARHYAQRLTRVALSGPTLPRGSAMSTTAQSVEQQDCLQ